MGTVGGLDTAPACGGLDGAKPLTAFSVRVVEVSRWAERLLWRGGGLWSAPACGGLVWGEAPGCRVGATKERAERSGGAGGRSPRGGGYFCTHKPAGCWATSACTLWLREGYKKRLAPAQIGRKTLTGKDFLPDGVPQPSNFRSPSVKESVPQPSSSVFLNRQIACPNRQMPFLIRQHCGHVRSPSVKPSGPKGATTQISVDNSPRR